MEVGSTLLDNKYQRGKIMNTSVISDFVDLYGQFLSLGATGDKGKKNDLERRMKQQLEQLTEKEQALAVEIAKRQDQSLSVASSPDVQADYSEVQVSQMHRSGHNASRRHVSPALRRRVRCFLSSPPVLITTPHSPPRSDNSCQPDNASPIEQNGKHR